MPLHMSSTVVLIIWRSKLYYTTYGNITLKHVYYVPLHVSSTMCSSSGGKNFFIQHLVLSNSVGGRPVHRLREDSLSIILVINQLNGQNVVL